MDDRSRLNTFLHGIEPRAWVFLQVHCNDPTRAAALFRDTLAAFARESAGEPLASWPMRFWTILLAQPGLAVDPATPGEGGLARVPPGPRAAFLLPMIAGLNEPHASEALGVSAHALARALVMARMAWPDTEAHERLRNLLQARIRHPTAADRKAIQALRAEALAPLGMQMPVAKRRHPGWWVLLPALLALAWWGAWLWPGRSGHGLGQDEALPSVTLPPPPTVDAATIVTHPDYLLLAAPADAGFARDFALLAWFDSETTVAASVASSAIAGDKPAVPAPEVSDVTDFSVLPDAERELLAPARPAWPGLDVPTRRRLEAQAADWLQRTPIERDALRGRMLAWDRLAIAERARRRAPVEAWLQLSEDDQHELRSAAQRWSALPAAQQAEARARFALLPADAQRLWWLGPTLGRELAPIAARFAFLPEDQRDAFLATLRGLDSRGRANFIDLTARLEPGERERLRQDLQAQAPEQRNAWLQAKRPQ